MRGSISTATETGAGRSSKSPSSRPVVEGANLITFDVPSSARIGTTVARFRLSTAGSLFVHGWSADGEVEDHVLTIAAPVASVAVFNHPKAIGSGTSLYSSFSADVDNDGDMDVLADVLGNDQIVWYLNDGNQNFTPHVVGTSTLPVEALNAADMDRDGDLDVLAATRSALSGAESIGTKTPATWSSRRTSGRRRTCATCRFTRPMSTATATSILCLGVNREEAHRGSSGTRTTASKTLPRAH